VQVAIIEYARHVCMFQGTEPFPYSPILAKGVAAQAAAPFVNFGADIQLCMQFFPTGLT